MEKNVKVMDEETKLLAEKAAFFAVFLVTLILAALASKQFGFSADYNPLIAFTATALAIVAYLYQLQKTKKVEVTK